MWAIMSRKYDEWFNNNIVDLESNFIESSRDKFEKFCYDKFKQDKR